MIIFVQVNLFGVVRSAILPHSCFSSDEGLCCFDLKVTNFVASDVGLLQSYQFCYSTLFCVEEGLLHYSTGYLNMPSDFPSILIEHVALAILISFEMR